VANVLTVAYETLEVYGVTQCYDYPADTMVRMTNIEIKRDTAHPVLTWNTASPVNEYGQKTVVINPSTHNGEVDIYYHEPCTTTGINNVAAVDNDINIFPNPATTNITIIAKGINNSTISIYNIQGQIIKQISTIKITTNIDISDLSGGVYFVEIKNEKNYKVMKLVKE